MPEIIPFRANLRTEDVEYRASISQSVGNTIGGAVNFVNTRQADQHSWNLNGDFSVVQASDVGDGVFICQEDMELVGYSLYIGTNGATGSSIICDLHFISFDGTDNGSIFSTKPEIATSAASGSFTHSNVRAASNVVPTGHTLGVFSKINFDRHDGIRFDLDQSTGGAQDLNLIIFFRPR